MKLGRTIAGNLEKTESESERRKLHEQKRKKDRFRTIVFVLIIIIIVALLYFFIESVFLKPKQIEVKQMRYEPSVQIIDESGYGRLTEKVKEYVGKIERDLLEMNLKIEKVVLPSNKIREVDVYLEGKKGYYKCNLDRGTAETAEDISRMVRYLEGNNIVIQQYVDVRIGKKAFYL